MNFGRKHGRKFLPVFGNQSCNVVATPILFNHVVIYFSCQRIKGAQWKILANSWRTKTCRPRIPLLARTTVGIKRALHANFLLNCHKNFVINRTDRFSIGTLRIALRIAEYAFIAVQITKLKRREVNWIWRTGPAPAERIGILQLQPQSAPCAAGMPS